MLAPEIIACPLTLYVAEVGTEFPAIDVSPGGSWSKVGTSGDLNYAEEGVTVEHQQTVKLWRAAGDSGPRKGFMDEEGMIVKLVLADITLEQYAFALNYQTPAATPAGGGSVGFKTIGLSRGPLLYRALLVRGPRASGYGEGWPAQYEIPVAVQMGSPSLVYRRADPVGIALEWATLVDPEASTPEERFGRLRMQHEIAAS